MFLLLLLLACAAPVPHPGGAEVSAKGETGAGSDTADTGGCVTPQGAGSGGNHGSPENAPYDIAAFDDVASCAGCHPVHYDEWHGSIHAYAAQNPVMWSGSLQVGETTGNTTVCLGCHAPIATLTNTLPFGVPLGEPSVLSAQAARGVSCVSCHKLYDVVNGVNQYTHCEDWYAGTLPDPTPTDAHANHTSPIHGEALVCRSCHNVENLRHTQVEFTYSEWQEANAAAGGAEDDPAIATCQDCHMPAYTGPAARGGVEREAHRHTFVGGDIALTPFPDAHRQYNDVAALMRTAGDIVADPLLDGDTLVGVAVDVTNLVEGHDLPTGSAFDREVWIELYVTAADGTVLLASGDRDADGDLRDEHSALDPGGDFWITNRLSVFRSYLTDDDGLETFDFIGAAVSVEDHSLVAGETRTVEYAVADGPRPLSIEARLLYRPYPPFLLREHGLTEAQVASVPIFEIARATEVLP